MGEISSWCLGSNLWYTFGGGCCEGWESRAEEFNITIWGLSRNIDSQRWVNQTIPDIGRT